MMVWIGPKKLRVVSRADARRYRPAFKRGEDFIEDAERLPARRSIRGGAQQIFLGHHFQDGADVLRHAAMDEDEAVLEMLAGFRGIIGRE
jgi:hypothetical protein